MKKKRKNILIKGVFYASLMVFAFIYFSEITGYYEYSNNKIKRFEKFLKKYEALCKQRRLDRKKQREEIFSFKNSEDKTHKILTILGLKLKFRRKNG